MKLGTRTCELWTV